MGRRARQFSLSDADRAELERISRSRTEAKQRVDRAKIILGCCDGEAQTALAQRLGTRPNTVSKWRSRFARLGLKGLVDAPPPGKPERYVGTRTGAENRGDAAPEGTGAMGRTELDESGRRQEKHCIQCLAEGRRSASTHAQLVRQH
jgi:transposase-like protein